MALARLVELKKININFQKEVLIMLNLTSKKSAYKNLKFKYKDNLQ